MPLWWSTGMPAHARREKPLNTMQYNNAIVLLGRLTVLLEYFDLQNPILFEQLQNFPRSAPWAV